MALLIMSPAIVYPLWALTKIEHTSPKPIDFERATETERASYVSRFGKAFTASLDKKMPKNDVKFLGVNEVDRSFSVSVQFDDMLPHHLEFPYIKEILTASNKMLCKEWEEDKLVSENAVNFTLYYVNNEVTLAEIRVSEAHCAQLT
ncbi:MAG: hypothetical protein AAGE89_01355 [Pseudomonadota bacterium]